MPWSDLVPTLLPQHSPFELNSALAMEREPGRRPYVYQPAAGRE